ncbi:glutamate-cysteine ligase family protein [Peptoniphilus catoniae]|uniref:glutamate-cysteine ligase family protein n=1 Tax=Peptoniphilus catoniae TaxID=1660341 RepID=UPI0010FD4321|nr:glutamate-cysteine ligase family protein [Peptoniphilus catoniae]
MDSKLIKEKIKSYIKNGETPRSDFTVGGEFENFIISNNTFKTISYYGENGVEESIRELCSLYKAQPLMDDDYMLGFFAENFSISTEPGAQFEISIKSQGTIAELERIYVDFMKNAVEIFKKKNQSIISLGYHPVTKIDEITLLPKKRYSYMFEHFKKRGSMAHNMMKGSGSVQVAIDFENERDFIRKFHLGSALSPIFYSMFDNAPIFEGEVYNKHNLRQKIWENTDSERSGLLKIGFDKDFSYDKYANFILNTTPIFIERDGKLSDAQGKKFYEIFNEDDSDELIFHALSIVFPDLRVKTYLEFRMFDAVPYKLNFAAVALIKGLFYSEENLLKLESLYKDSSYELAMRAKADSEETGLYANYLGRSILDHGKELINLASSGLDSKEKSYLDPIKELMDEGLTPKDIFYKNKDKKDLKELLKADILEMKNV